jgi:TetR/AcrR family transcriptional regulator, tetracycline repressor protein
MSVADETSTGSKGKRRGGPLRISRDKILEVARTFDPQTLTMQAVADELGVDRKALNYHVTDRQGLMRLVAADVFESSFTSAFHDHLATAEDWEATLSAWAHAVRDGLVATGSLTNYYRIRSENPSIFEPAELVLQRMIGAGFEAATAGRALVFATTFSMGVGRDMVMESQLGEHPQGPEVRRVLGEGDAAEFGALRQMIDANVNGPHDIQAQFEFDLGVFLDGMRARLHAV